MDGKLRVRLLTRGFRQFGEACVSAAKSIQHFSDTFQLALALPAYQAAHNGRLTGSTRTARLRKKRRDVVLRWWRAQ